MRDKCKKWCGSLDIVPRSVHTIRHNITLCNVPLCRAKSMLKSMRYECRIECLMLLFCYIHDMTDACGIH